MKFKVSLLLLAIVSLMVSAACTKDEVQKKPEEQVLPTIELSDKAVLLTKDNLEVTYQFKISDYTDGMPVVESTADWLTVQNVEKGENGANFQSFRFKMTAVLREGLSSAEVKVTYKDAEEKVFKVELDNRPVPVISSSYDYHHLGLDGKEDWAFTFAIDNYTDGMPMLESTADWLVIGEVELTTPLDNSATYTVNFSAAATENPRSAQVKITYKNAEQKEIQVVQDGLPQPEFVYNGKYETVVDLGLWGGEVIYKFGIRNYSGGNPKLEIEGAGDWLTIGELEKVEDVDGIQYYQFKLQAGPTDVYDHSASLTLNYKNAFLKRIIVKQWAAG